MGPATRRALGVDVTDRTLIYIPANQIVDYIRINPIRWGNAETARRGGVGDSAGPTPTPAVEEFIGLLLARRGLFTQAEYAAALGVAWGPWLAQKTEDQRRGVMAKAYRNWYPAMIDSLHVFSLLTESSMFDRVVMSSDLDARGKADILAYSGERVLRIAILGPMQAATDDRAAKLAQYGGEPAIELRIPRHYPQSPGNKRWLTKTDLMQAILGAQSPDPEPRHRGPESGNTYDRQ